MKYRVHYNIPKIVEFDLEEGQDLKEVAFWSARHISGADVQVTHILAVGEELQQDLPRKVDPELPPPPMPPLATSPELMLQRVA